MRRLLLAFSLTALCGCGLFQASAYPGYLTLIGGQASLGQEIPSASASLYTLSSVTTTAGDRVFLATSQPVAGTALFVMDERLNILQRFTNAQLVALFGGPLPNSPRAILDLAGNVVILGLVSSLSSGGLTGLAPPGEIPNAGSFGFADAPSNIAGFQTLGNLLRYYIYTPPPPWGAGMYEGDFLITPDPTLSFNLIDVRADPLRSDAVLVLEEMTSNKDYFILLPRSGYLTGLSWPFTISYPFFTTDRYDRDLIGYTQNGFIALQRSNNGTNKFVRFDMTGAMLPDSLEYDGPTDLQISTRSDGGWYYTYDRQSRQVIRMNAWWGR
jgi:hypothetical protein